MESGRKGYPVTSNNPKTFETFDTKAEARARSVSSSGRPSFAPCPTRVIGNGRCPPFRVARAKFRRTAPCA